MGCRVCVKGVGGWGATNLDGGLMVFDLSFQTLVLLAQVLHTCQVPPIVIGAHQQLLLPSTDTASYSTVGHDTIPWSNSQHNRHQ